MKIVIAGAGQVGRFLTEMLTEEQQHDILVIDNDRDIINEVNSHYDVLALHGSATSINTLKEAEVGSADLFITVTSHQETNIIASMLAKKLGAKRCVARVDQDEFIEPEHRTLFEELGVDSLIFPEILASEEIVNYLKRPSILKSVNFASGKLSLFTIKVTEKSGLADLTLAEIDKKYPDVVARIVAIQRKEETIIPKGDNYVRVGDILYIVTNKDGTEHILNITGIRDEEIKNVMILGGSRVGIKVARKLQKCCYVKLFEKDKEKSIELAEELSDTLVINSEARDGDFLMEEGIERTDAFIAVTGNSEINMLSCMLAKKLGVKKTIAEVENTDYLRLIQNMDIDLVINKKMLAASHIFTFTINAEVLSVKYFADTKARVLEFVAHEGSKITGKPLKEINFPKRAIIGGIERNGQTLIAVGDTIIQPNDKVVVFALPDVVNKVASFFK